MEKIQTVLITGSSSGIGKSVALRYLKQGATVGICGRRAEALEEIRTQFPNAHPIVFDITNKSEAKKCIESFVSSVGYLDLAILNAGNHKPTDGRDFDVESYISIVETNYFGTLNCLDAVIPAMKKQGRGTIAIVGSVAGYIGLPQAGAYCASKAALMRLTETLGVELKPLNIDVKLISPGFVKTPLTDKNDFDMPLLMEVEKASDRIINGIAQNRFETAFPRRLAWGLKILAVLPKFLFMRIAKKMLR